MYQRLGPNYVKSRKTSGFQGGPHISNAIIRCNRPYLGYAFVKSGELISLASPVGNDEYFVSGFPEAATRRIARPGVRGALARAMR